MTDIGPKRQPCVARRRGQNAASAIMSRLCGADTTEFPEGVGSGLQRRVQRLQFEGELVTGVQVDHGSRQLV